MQRSTRTAAGRAEVVVIAAAIGGCSPSNTYPNGPSGDASVSEARDSTSSQLLDVASDGDSDSQVLDAASDGDSDSQVLDGADVASEASSGACCPIGVVGSCGYLGGWDPSGACPCFVDPGLCDGVIGKDSYGCDTWIHNASYVDYTSCQRLDAGDGGAHDAGDARADDDALAGD
jgi:hypothetical protein